MVQRLSWKVYTGSAAQEIRCLCGTQILISMFTKAVLDPGLRQKSSAHPIFLKFHFNIIQTRSCLFKLSDKKFVCIFYLLRSTYPTHLILRDLIALIIYLGERCKLTYKCYLLLNFYHTATSSFLGWNILISLTHSHTRSVRMVFVDIFYIKFHVWFGW
jgi:hypothetical protein